MRKRKAVRQSRFKWSIENRWNDLPAKNREEAEKLLGQLLAAIAKDERTLGKENRND